MTTELDKQIKALKESGMFDPDWYCAQHPDVDMTGLDPATHYLRYGHRMNRDPGPGFSTRFARVAYGISDEREPLARRAWMRRQAKGAPVAANPKRVLLAANKVAMTGDHTRAIALAEEHLPADLAYTADILRANAALAHADEAGWQQHLNTYLAHFGVAPIRLEGHGTVFDRLACAPLPPVTGGPLVSVIMPAWNAEKTVEKAARSILNQTWRNLELLIVDDASTDGTWAVLQRLAATDTRVKIFRNAVNVGPYVSKNIALSQAKGAWITGHDADDWAHPERLAAQIGFCAENRLTACMSGMLRVAGTGEFVRFNPVGEFVHDGACRSGFISLMVRTQFARDILGGWDHVRTSGDSELLRRIEILQEKEVRKIPIVTMFCLDNPEGLTNDKVLGHSENSGVSPIRRAYKKAFMAWHDNISGTSARIDLFDSCRKFPAPPEIIANPSDIVDLLDSYGKNGIEIRKSVCADVVCVTSTAFPGGNASSSLDELDWCEALGLTYALVHCPVDRFKGAENSPRYDRHRDHWYHWSEVHDITTRVLICRHPSVIISSAFSSIQASISAERAFFVINNSRFLTDGSAAYDTAELGRRIRAFPAGQKTLCPISDLIRAELQASGDVDGIALSAVNWHPTFDPDTYAGRPKPALKAPFVIGRHGRDGGEKWHEDPKALRQVYPDSEDFKIHILGGARYARKILKKLPANWKVYEFGAIEPREYLSNLDAFVYFSNSSLVEAFGRTIIEAMLAGVPVILPQRFEATFGDLPLYCEPHQVADLVRRLARDDAARVAWLTELQQIATERYSSRVIARRLADTGLPGLDAVTGTSLVLSSASKAYRAELMRSLEVNA